MQFLGRNDFQNNNYNIICDYNKWLSLYLQKRFLSKMEINFSIFSQKLLGFIEWEINFYTLWTIYYTSFLEIFWSLGRIFVFLSQVNWHLINMAKGLQDSQLQFLFYQKIKSHIIKECMNKKKKKKEEVHFLI